VRPEAIGVAPGVCPGPLGSGLCSTARHVGPEAPLVASDVEGAVATLTLDRPEALNALTVPVKVALRAALESLNGDRDVRAVILTGAGRAGR